MIAINDEAKKKENPPRRQGFCEGAALTAERRCHPLFKKTKKKQQERIKPVIILSSGPN